MNPLFSLCVCVLCYVLLLCRALEVMEPFHGDVLEEDIAYYSHKPPPHSTVSTPTLIVRLHSLS